VEDETIDSSCGVIEDYLYGMFSVTSVKSATFKAIMGFLTSSLALAAHI
jgi:hypothetical protein